MQPIPAHRKGELYATNGKATLYRKETYNHGTSAKIAWLVLVGDLLMRECATRKDALTWLDIYAN